MAKPSLENPKPKTEGATTRNTPSKPATNLFSFCKTLKLKKKKKKAEDGGSKKKKKKHKKHKKNKKKHKKEKPNEKRKRG